MEGQKYGLEIQLKVIKLCVICEFRQAFNSTFSSINFLFSFSFHHGVFIIFSIGFPKPINFFSSVNFGLLFFFIIISYLAFRDLSKFLCISILCLFFFFLNRSLLLFYAKLQCVIFVK